MNKIIWREEFSVGNAAVDQEHQELIETINALFDVIGAESEKDPVVDGLGEIYTMIASHFALAGLFCCWPLPLSVWVFIMRVRFPSHLRPQLIEASFSPKSSFLWEPVLPRPSVLPLK